MKIYLAGPIPTDPQLFDYAARWREKFESIANTAGDGVKILSPLKGKTKISETNPGFIQSRKSTCPEICDPTQINFNAEFLVKKDLKMVEEADIVLVNVVRPYNRNKVVTGTVCEVFYASYILKKPVLATIDTSWCKAGDAVNTIDQFCFEHPWFYHFFLKKDSGKALLLQSLEQAYQACLQFKL